VADGRWEGVQKRVRAGDVGRDSCGGSAPCLFGAFIMLAYSLCWHTTLYPFHAHIDATASLPTPRPSFKLL